MLKKIIIIWDFDGAIGQINSTYPYNFGFQNFEKEINNVKEILSILDKHQIKTCFSITGFSAENGKFPYVFPDLIKTIYEKGHEISSHSWRHEWIPIFRKEQLDRSIKRSKFILEKTIESKQHVIGFVPPHNRPMTWVSKGAFSIGDRGLFPFFKNGTLETVLTLLKKNNYKWIRISHQNIFQKFKIIKKNITGRIYKHKGLLILENHYNGFDSKVIDHILNSNYDTYTISSHPLMYSFLNKKESKENFLNFLKKIKESDQKIEFVLPNSLL